MRMMMILTALMMLLTLATCKKKKGKTLISFGPYGVHDAAILSFGPYGNLPDATFLFNDAGLYNRNGKVTEILIYVGEYASTSNIITGIQLTYGSLQGPLWGGSGNKNVTCKPKGEGLYFGGTYGTARTQRTFDSFIYLLAFRQTGNGKPLCLAGTNNEHVPQFDIQAPAPTTYTLAFVSGTQIPGEMLGGLRFHFSMT